MKLIELCGRGRHKAGPFSAGKTNPSPKPPFTEYVAFHFVKAKQLLQFPRLGLLMLTTVILSPGLP